MPSLCFQKSLLLNYSTMPIKQLQRRLHDAVENKAKPELHHALSLSAIHVTIPASFSEINLYNSSDGIPHRGQTQGNLIFVILNTRILPPPFIPPQQDLLPPCSQHLTTTTGEAIPSKRGKHPNSKISLQFLNNNKSKDF